MSKELIELIKDNPDLPIFAWVNGELCADSYGYWLGQFNSASIHEYTRVEPYDCFDKDFIFKDDYVDYLEYMLEKEENIDMTEEEAIKIIESFVYKKAIFVYVDEPKGF